MQPLAYQQQSSLIGRRETGLRSACIRHIRLACAVSLLHILCCATYHLPHKFDDSENDATPPPPKKKPKVEKGRRFLTGFKGFEKDSAGNESTSVGISEDSNHSQSESIPSPPPQALSEGDTPVTAKKPKVEQETTRTIVDAWFKLFPWLTYDKEEKVMRNK